MARKSNPKRRKVPMRRTQGEACGPLPVPWAGARELGVDLAPVRQEAKRLRARVDAGKYPGYVLCVAKAGRVLHAEAYGFADVAGRTPMRTDTLFRLYSQTKPITVVAFMRLWERGLVGLQDEVARYIPGFKNLLVGPRRLPAVRPMLVRDLLAHTSGIGAGPGFGYEAGCPGERKYVELIRKVDRGEVRSLKAWCEELAKIPLDFHPGQWWGYGYSTDVLGRVAEVVSGRPLDELLRVEVLEPLGMRDTHFAVPGAKAPRLAGLYRRDPCGLVPVDAGGTAAPQDQPVAVTRSPESVFLEGRAPTVLQGGGCVCTVAGGMVSTLKDYFRLGQLFLQEGEVDGVRLLKAETVRLLASDWLGRDAVGHRKKVWVWDRPGIGFSPLGQIGVPHPKAGVRNHPGSKLGTVHWGGAGGSWYVLNWPHQLMVLGCTGLVFDQMTQNGSVRAAFGALRRGGAKAAQRPQEAVPAPLALLGGTSNKPGGPRTPERRKRPRDEACSPGNAPASSTKLAPRGGRLEVVVSPARKRPCAEPAVQHAHGSV